MADVRVGGITYGQLKATNPEYLGGYWRRLDAFYSGGRKLLDDDALMRSVFPQHNAEDDSVYLERRKRAFYINHAGNIIDHLVAALFGDPIKLDLESGDPDEFWSRFSKDCSRSGGKKLPFSRLLRDRIVGALKWRRMWTLIDLEAGDPAAYRSRRDQEAAGGLEAYAVPLSPFEVLDWEDDDDGSLAWIKRCATSRPCPSPASPRNLVREEYTIYTRGDWTKYVVEYHDPAPSGGSGRERPDDGDVIYPAEDPQPHSFGRVPVAVLELPEGLWAMDRLESAVREFFNKLCAVAWFEYKCCFPLPYEFLGTEIPTLDTPISEAQQDPSRGVSQKRGVGYIQVRGREDRAEYIGPPPEILRYALESLSALKEEIYRILFSLALATENSAAALGRSADSKAQDKAATSVLLTALGDFAKEHAVEIYELAATGRKETGEWCASGMETFDPIALSDLVEQALSVENVPIPSPTFQRIWKRSLARRLVATEASDEDLAAVDDELKAAYTADQFAAISPPPVRRGDPTEDEDEDEPPPGRKATLASGVVFPEQ